MKLCSRCRLFLPVELFQINVNGRAKDKRLSYCKPCGKELYKSWLLKRSEEKVKSDRLRNARRAAVRRSNYSDEEKFARLVYSQLNELARLNKRNPEVDRKNRRAWKERNPERRRQLDAAANKRARECLADSYVRQVVVLNTPGISPAAVPPQLIEAKREHLKNARVIRALKSELTNQLEKLK